MAGGAYVDDYLKVSGGMDHIQMAVNYLANMSAQEFKWFCQTRPEKDMAVVQNGVDMRLALEWNKYGIKSVPIKIDGVEYDLDVNGWLNSRGPGEYKALDGGEALRTESDRLQRVVVHRAERLSKERHREPATERIESVMRTEERLEKTLCGKKAVCQEQRGYRDRAALPTNHNRTVRENVVVNADINAAGRKSGKRRVSADLGIGM